MPSRDSGHSSTTLGSTKAIPMNNSVSRDSLGGLDFYSHLAVTRHPSLSVGWYQRMPTGELRLSSLSKVIRSHPPTSTHHDVSRGYVVCSTRWDSYPFQPGRYQWKPSGELEPSLPLSNNGALPLWCQQRLSGKPVLLPPLGNNEAAPPLLLPQKYRIQ